jgi:4-amino-4-deoxy-L-arabinose transferase-like glycosyltransferase
MALDLTRPAHQRLILLLCGGVLFFYGLGDRDLTSSHEARAAQNAQVMLSTGEWLLPRLFDGHPELQKPPLYYWLVALLGLVSGGQVGPWAVRLPAALSALGCVLFVHLVGCRRGRPVAGFLAALVLATCTYFTCMGRVGRIDMPLTFAVTVALGSVHLGRAESGGRHWYLLGYTALGLGVLLKGPIALVLPAVVGLTDVRRALGDWRRSTLWWGLPWVLLIAAPWFVWANAETGGRLWEVFFWYHNVERGLGGSETLKAHPWWFYGGCGAIDLLPWSLAIVPLAWAWLRRAELRRDGDAGFGLCWFGAVLAFLSCMSFKRADYLLPAYPGFALLVGCAAERLADRRTLVTGFAVTAAACALGWLGYNTWVVPGQEADWPYRRIADLIRARTDRPVIFFRAESHVLAFHLGQPVDTILEWENLQWWAQRDFTVYVVMPEDAAREWPEHLPGASFEEVLRTRDWLPGRRDHAMVVLRTRPTADGLAKGIACR